jgi:hypothetical protein
VGVWGNARNVYGILAVKALAKRLLQRPRSIWKNNVTTDIQATSYEEAMWIDLTEDGV